MARRPTRSEAEHRFLAALEARGVPAGVVGLQPSRGGAGLEAVAMVGGAVRRYESYGLGDGAIMAMVDEIVRDRGGKA